MANLCRLHPGQAKLMLPTGGKAAMFQTMEMNWGTTQGWFRSQTTWIWTRSRGGGVPGPVLTRRIVRIEGTCFSEEPFVSPRFGQVRIKMQMSYCQNAEWTKCQSIFFNMRYEIDVDRLVEESVISGERQVRPTAVIFGLWNKICPPPPLFRSINNSCTSFTETILKT